MKYKTITIKWKELVQVVGEGEKREVNAMHEGMYKAQRGGKFLSLIQLM